MNTLGSDSSPRILLLGATGTIGRATATKLVSRGYHVVCPVRPQAGVAGESDDRVSSELFPGAELLFGEITDPRWLADEVFRQHRYDAVVSCLASRSGNPRDSWAIDYQAHHDCLQVARQSGTRQFVLLSAICVQKPRLAFQHAKLAFEQVLIESGLSYSIVRPTAYFKSLSGQVSRVQSGKPYLVFGDGHLTACKPISDRDLAGYLVDCLEDVSLQNRILPIGGPGPAMTPLEQGQQLFGLLGSTPQFRQVPPWLLAGIASLLGGLGKLLPSLAVKAELARIGHYYATESMLVLNSATGEYDADATPETGEDRLVDYYRDLIEGRETLQLGDHAVFSNAEKRGTG